MIHIADSYLGDVVAGCQSQADPALRCMAAMQHKGRKLEMMGVWCINAVVMCVQIAGHE